MLTLSTLGLLSVAGAKSDLNLARKNAEAVKNYYGAVNAAEAFLQETDGKIREADAKGTDDGGKKAALSVLAAGSYDEAADLLTADIGMDNGRALRVSLRPVWEPEAGYELKDYSVYISEDYEIDRKRPVWTGT